MESSSWAVEKETTSSGAWTDEKHVHFLNTIEASFVTTMLHRYRLDRHHPHTSHSKPNNSNTHALSLSPSDSMVPRMRTRRTRRRTRRRTSQPLNSSQEQVVPQLENAREGFGENDD